MPNFIISIKVTIDKIKTQTGLIGCISRSEAQGIELVRGTIVNQYKCNYPYAKHIEVECVEVKTVSSDEYSTLAKNLTSISSI